MNGALGLHFAVGTRDGRVRTALVALASGFAIALLLLAVSVPGALAARAARSDARDPHLIQPAGDSRLLWGDVDFVTTSGPVTGALVHRQSAPGPLPPGVAALPAPGTMLVSPALAVAIGHDRVLAARLPYRVAGTLGDADLLGPSDLRFVAADDRLTPATPGVAGVLNFDVHQDTEPLDPVLALLLVVGVVVLLLPIAVVVVIAGRFGAERRDRRLAALRLAGVSARGVGGVLGAEALVGALAGVAVGIGVFFAARQLLRFVSIASLSVFPEDAVPPLPLALLVLLVVPATVVAAALAGLRGVAVEPLGVSRRAGRRARRLWWRLIPLAGGGALLAATGGSFDRGRSGSVLTVAGGVTLLLVAALALLPWIVERMARVAPGGGVPWRFARGRLVHEGGTTVRVVGAVCALTAGAIALQMLFAGLAGGYATSNDTSVPTVLVNPATTTAAAADTSALEQRTPLVTQQVSVGVRGRTDAFVTLAIGSCRALAELAPVPGCRAGSVYRSAGDSPAGPGVRLALGRGTWQVPAHVVPTGRARDNAFNVLNGVLLVEQHAIRLQGPVAPAVYASSDAAAFPALIGAALQVDPLAQVTLPDAGATTHQFDAVRRGLTVGLVLVLLLVGAVLLVGVIDQLRERRAALATLAAIGMRRRAMAASILWEGALPVLTGAVVAAAAGLALGLVLLRVMSREPALDPLIAADVVLAVLVPLAVTAAGLPLAARLMRPEGLRAE